MSKRKSGEETQPWWRAIEVIESHVLVSVEIQTEKLFKKVYEVYFGVINQRSLYGKVLETETTLLDKRGFSDENGLHSKC